MLEPRPRFGPEEIQRELEGLEAFRPKKKTAETKPEKELSVKAQIRAQFEEDGSDGTEARLKAFDDVIGPALDKLDKESEASPGSEVSVEIVDPVWAVNDRGSHNTWLIKDRLMKFGYRVDISVLQGGQSAGKLAFRISKKSSEIAH